LLTCGADVKTRNCYGESALHMAAQPGHVELVKMLMSAGADPTVQQAYGRTAFDYAAETTSFVMLHSPLDRLRKREEVCRLLYPHLTKEQKKRRSLSERVSMIVIAQVPELSDPFKCRMVDYNTASQGASKSKPSGNSTNSTDRSASRTSSNGPSSSSSNISRPASSRPPSGAGAPRVRKATVPKGPNLSSGSRVRSREKDAA